MAKLEVFTYTIVVFYYLMMFILLTVSHVLFVIICLLTSWFYSYCDIREKFKFMTGSRTDRDRTVP